MRFCFIAGWLILAAFAAAESAPSGSQPDRLMSVVRADPRTGRLVRSTRVPSQPAGGSAAKAWQKAAASIDRYVRDSAERYQVDPLLVHSVIQVESNFDPFAVSPKGAQGLMQLMPQTARRFDVKDSFNPWQNIDGGVRYLRYLLDRFAGTETPETLALAAYNAGEGAVAKHRGVPPYRETTQYVRKVEKKRGDAQAATQGGANPQADPKAPAQPVIEEYTDSQGILHIRTRPAS